MASKKRRTWKKRAISQDDATKGVRLPSTGMYLLKADEGWVEIQLEDESGQPLSGERYTVKLPDGTQRDGSLDGQGLARIEGFGSGTCDVSFPDRDPAAWALVAERG